MKGLGVIEPFILALEDADSSVQMAVVDALGWMGNERALDLLRHVRGNDKDTRVQEAAQVAVDLLKQILEQGGIQSP